MDRETPAFLAGLRRIGFDVWDPLEIAKIHAAGFGAFAFEGQYDGYLLQAAGRLLRGGEPASAVVTFMEDAEQSLIGLARRSSMRERAVQAVAAIEAYVKGLDGARRSPET